MNHPYLEQLNKVQFQPERTKQGQVIEGKEKVLKELLTGVFKAIPYFEQVREKDLLTYILHACARAFPFNKETIARIVTGEMQKAKAMRPAIKTPMKAVKIENNYPDTSEGCVGCKETVTKKTPKLTDAKDYKEVVEFFMAGVGEEKALVKMKQFASANAISHSHLIRLDGLAKKILKFLKEPGQVISKETL